MYEEYSVVQSDRQTGNVLTKDVRSGHRPRYRHGHKHGQGHVRAGICGRVLSNSLLSVAASVNTSGQPQKESKPSK